MKKIVIFLLVLVPLNVKALTPSESYAYSSYDYVIDAYDINIIVNEDNTFDITETISAYFNVESHGIYRLIPLKNTVTRLDGTVSSNTAEVTNISVDNEYIVYKIDDYYRVQIGNSNYTITGLETYEISYTYNIGKDPLDDKDEFYYNLIGDEWDTVIGNVTFSITMPKSFDSSKLGFSHGVVGSVDSSNIYYSVDGNTISGYYNGVLNAGEALTVHLELEEGYFVNAGLSFNFMYLIVFAIPLLLLGISVLLWLKFGRDDLVVETVEFYPPEGFNSLEVGFLYKGRANNKDVTSLLIYLANRGYIKIIEMEAATPFNTTDTFKIVKLKDYDGNNINEMLFMEGLFKDAKRTAVDTVEVSSTMLEYKFYTTMNKILNKMNAKENKEKIVVKKTGSIKALMVIMCLLTFIVISIPPIIAASDSLIAASNIDDVYSIYKFAIMSENMSTIALALLFPGLGFGFLFGSLFNPNASKETKIFFAIWGLMFGGLVWWFLVLPILQENTIYLIAYLLGVVYILIMIYWINHLNKRTPYGRELLGKIKGFKNFLEVAEKEKLEAMVNSNPTYFYDILPYAYVLGVSDKWIKEFESIASVPPSWYDGVSDFSTHSFGVFINTTMRTSERSFSASPSSSSSDGGSSGGSSSSSSGGGSSGGGSGGGGGGRW